MYVAFDVPDLALTRLVSPVSTCGLDANTLLSIEIANNGFFRISPNDTLVISYSVDGGASFIEQVHLTEDLPRGQTTVLSYSTGYDFSATGTYQVQTSLIYTPDVNTIDNTLFTSIDVWDPLVVEIGGGSDTLVTTLPVTLDAGTGFSSYLWQDNSTASTLSAAAYGLYWVTVTNSYGCAASDSVYVASLTSSNEIEAPSGAIRIYPNPVQDYLHITLDLTVKREVVLELYSTSGSLIYREDIKQAGISEALIDVQQMTPGTYFLRIIADNVPYNFLVIVE